MSNVFYHLQNMQSEIDSERIHRINWKNLSNLWSGLSVSISEEYLGETRYWSVAPSMDHFSMNNARVVYLNLREFSD